ncbi:MAG: SEL1-like repeat protein [Campylobacterales bacterium]|nr:SEL1-like repeat protein [Campylobacterales bacterium]
MRHLIFIVLAGLFLSGCGNVVNTVQGTFYGQMGDHHYNNGAYRDAFEAYKTSAQAGDGSSYYRLYSMYFHGLGVPKDDAIATKMLEEAARLGYPAAEVGVANRLIFTTPKNRDMKRGLALLESAASKEHPYAYADLYTIYWNGIGVKRDVAKAGEYYRLAKANGFDVRAVKGATPPPAKISAKELTASVQNGLKALGFYKGGVDGMSGPMTRKSIEAFQQFYGYPVNTEITPSLLKEIKSRQSSR